MRIIKSLTFLLAMLSPALAADNTPSSAVDVRSKLTDWPQGVQEISIEGAKDGQAQPAMYFSPAATAPVPLLVLLHPWSSNHLYASGITFAKACVAKNWAFIQPEFRGPNNQPKALGSDFVIDDIANAVAYAQANGNIDPKRIYLVGASGGGHAALLAAGRLPGVFSAISAWVPISDVTAWYHQVKDTPYKNYARDIVKACAGHPLPGSAAEKEAILRSPITHLEKAQGSEIDINTGIQDGHEGGSVPISQSLLAYNLLAQDTDRIPLAAIALMEKEATIPDELKFVGEDSSYGKRKVIFRKASKNVRITVTDGKHEIISQAALAWLESIDQRKRQAVE